MWLLNTDHYELCEFVEGSIPSYAILSHTWGDDEITFDMVRRNGFMVSTAMKGSAKLVGACTQAQADGHWWIWIDTCCIDKDSSAALSEAINSMWCYYQDAERCYVYLSDVVLPDYGRTSHIRQWYRFPCKFQHSSDVSLCSLCYHIGASRWFKRGWTLQELLAPMSLFFFDHNWLGIGRRDDMLLLLERITGIPADFMSGRDLQKASIACKMSWAANRRTTRTDDIAYCLLGIFGINMPLLYGEGKKAFKRLQLELLRSSADQSILAWKAPQHWRGLTLAYESVLAESPSYFADCGSIIDNSRVYGISPSTIANVGIRISLQLGPIPRLDAPTEYKYNNADLRMIMLACSRVDPNDKDKRPERVGIGLRVTGTLAEKENGKPINLTQRAFSDYLHTTHVDSGWPMKTVYLAY